MGGAILIHQDSAANRTPSGTMSRRKWRIVMRTETSSLSLYLSAVEENPLPLSPDAK